MLILILIPMLMLMLKLALPAKRQCAEEWARGGQDNPVVRMRLTWKSWTASSRLEIFSLLVLVDIFLEVHNCAGFLMKLESCENLQYHFNREVRQRFGAANLGGIPLNTLAPTPHSAWLQQMHILQFSPGNQSVTAVRCLSKIGISKQPATTSKQPGGSTMQKNGIRCAGRCVCHLSMCICLYLCIFCICLFICVFVYLWSGV